MSRAEFLKFCALMAKEKYPEKFCPTKRCLWRTGGGYCPRHITQGIAVAAHVEVK